MRAISCQRQESDTPTVHSRQEQNESKIIILHCIPRCRDCFDLSSAAVDNRVESDFTRDVFPESTCPRMPTFTLITSSGFGGLSLIGGAFTAVGIVGVVDFVVVAVAAMEEVPSGFFPLPLSFSSLVTMVGFVCCVLCCDVLCCDKYTRLLR